MFARSLALIPGRRRMRRTTEPDRGAARVSIRLVSDRSGRLKMTGSRDRRSLAGLQGQRPVRFAAGRAGESATRAARQRRSRHRVAPASPSDKRNAAAGASRPPPWCLTRRRRVGRPRIGG
jgi:hypothetical protein